MRRKWIFVSSGAIEKLAAPFVIVLVALSAERISDSSAREENQIGAFRRARVNAKLSRAKQQLLVIIKVVKNHRKMF
jgi:hypothetical protein